MVVEAVAEGVAVERASLPGVEDAVVGEGEVVAVEGAVVRSLRHRAEPAKKVAAVRGARSVRSGQADERPRPLIGVLVLRLETILTDSEQAQVVGLHTPQFVVVDLDAAVAA